MTPALYWFIFYFPVATASTDLDMRVHVQIFETKEECTQVAMDRLGPEYYWRCEQWQWGDWQEEDTGEVIQ